MEIASLDGSVAVYVNNKGDAQKNLGVIRLSGDAKIFISKNYIWKTDCHLDGHTLSFGGPSGSVFLHRSGGMCSAGRIVVDKIRFLLRGSSVFQGDSGSVLETVNKATVEASAGGVVRTLRFDVSGEHARRGIRCPLPASGSFKWVFQD
jgi:hypothetical protein